MKKIIALVLTVILAFGLVACGGNNGDKTTSSSSSTTTSTTTSSTTSGTNDPVVDPTTDFEKVNETVYVIADSLNIRTSPDADDTSNIHTSYDYGESAIRIGYNETWSKLLIDGVEYFASSKYLTASKIVTEFNDCNETVYVTGIESIRVRSKTCLNDEVSPALAFLEEGEAVTRTGVAIEEDGEGILWSRVEFTIEDEEGNPVPVKGYINGKYLTTEEPEGPVYPQIDVEFDTATDVIVVLADSLNLRTYPKYEDASLSGVSASKNDELVRIGVATEPDADGITWSVVIYEGVRYFISTNPTYVQVKENSEREDTRLNAFEGKYSIELPGYFFLLSADTTQSVFASISEQISVVYTGDLGDAEFTAVEYAEKLIQVLGIEADVVEEDGLVYFVFAIENYYSMVFVTAGTGNDYYITTLEGTGAADELAETYIGYAKTIVVSTADAE